jgi:putative restriction endonuclease
MKAVFTTKRVSAYDDDPSERYHFPRTYLGQAERVLGNFIVYYEPRRTSFDLSSTGGLQSYFAVARLVRIEPDVFRPDHFYAFLDSYIDFDVPVSFSEGRAYFESALRKDDGTTNKGAFGRAVRLIPDEEFDMILRRGFTASREAETPVLSEGMPGFGEPPETFERPLIEAIITRPFRERAFARQVQAAYGQRCAVTGLRLINGGGRAEAQAAHIRPVADMGPDSVRNGITLSSTIHWMFDRGLISIDDDLRILKARSLLPEGAERLFHRSGMLIAPADEHLRPHSHFLRYHRENVFKGD